MATGLQIEGNSEGSGVALLQAPSGSGGQTFTLPIVGGEIKIKDSNSNIAATYDSATKTLVLSGTNVVKETIGNVDYLIVDSADESDIAISAAGGELWVKY
ncbi:MAG: hypothetical protein HOG97_01605 [Candidatus Marinimicrobia bacterium]|jgi:hypothetical protein|nr:hypothetical protein [Candidatus Neomarinimicrobiota bacterium]